MIKSRQIPAVLRFALVAMTLCLALPVHAALQVDITQSSDQAIPISIAPFKADGQSLPVDVSDIASRDLASTGLFRTMNRANMTAAPATPEDVNYQSWAAQGVDNLVIGSASRNAAGGYRITFYLLDVARQQTVTSFQINAGGNQLRDAGHTIANLIYERFIGKKGYFLSNIAYVTVNGSTAQNRTFRLVVADYDGSQPSTIYSSKDPVMSPAWSPNGDRIAYVAFDVYKGTSSVRIQNLASGQARTISAGHGVNGAPAWSPDGQQIAYAKSADGDTDLFVYNLATGQSRQLTRSGSIDTEPTWSPDGSTIVFTSDRGGQPQLYRMNAQGGGVQRLTYDGSSNQRADFAPDGKSIAFVQKSGNGFRIAVMELSNNNVRIISEGPLDDSPAFAPNGQAVLYARQGGRNALSLVSLDGGAKSTLSQAGEIREPAWGPINY
ncbi:Tol-Pal system beta propeller repeat protein TolB [uncultured Salinisphaera sp.]|uniref:Tol-Pal system beta propeller repeat protein TolB n=1 Tax=uncultured Salinisphaera sp. TaxID=359372 RepID=UPI0032B0F676|tara:strand:- start:3837 stop:5150 length:1314 start_codon:yes stop_codon:yes gene_type:complete